MTAPSNERPPRRVPVILVRHGATPWNRDGLVQGWTDIPLSEAGRLQAARAGHALTTHRVARILTSDLSRARETADIIAAILGVAVESHEGLREYNCGRWEGRPYLAIRAEEGEAFWGWFNDPDVPTPGGESMRQAAGRAVPVLEAATAAEASEPSAATPGALLVVGHGGINRLLAGHLLGLPLEAVKRLRLDNGSISVFEPFLGAWALKSWNDTGHLAGLPAEAEGSTASRIG
jgi:broad specificity phosphatase PhoE